MTCLPHMMTKGPFAAGPASNTVPRPKTTAWTDVPALTVTPAPGLSNPQSAIRNPQSAIPNRVVPSSLFPNPQSPIRNPQLGAPSNPRILGPFSSLIAHRGPLHRSPPEFFTMDSLRPGAGDEEWDQDYAVNAFCNSPFRLRDSSFGPPPPLVLIRRIQTERTHFLPW